MKFIDDFLNSITMYRLLLYYLIGLAIAAGIYSFADVLPFRFPAFLISTVFLVAASWLTNRIFSEVYDAHTNVESVYITALILALILTPATNIHDLAFLGWAAVLANASKYILAIGKKHLFNPVAIAAVLTAYVLGDGASWWVGTARMMPFVVAGGLLVLRKIRHEDLFFSFLATATAISLLYDSSLIGRLFIDTPLLFFGFVMLTEPLTTPPTRRLRIAYGIFTGMLFAPQLTFMTPELALSIGNVFSYLVSPKEKLLLRLKEKIPIAPNMYDYIFENTRKFAFEPGQYMEWTLGHEHADSRGNRRYFTIASSPTEPTIRIGVRFSDTGSSYKSHLRDFLPGSTIMAGQRAGDFTLPADKKQKLAFIAGGIGITPFRSMIKYLLDTGEKRDAVLLYSNKTADEIVYRGILDAAKARLGIKTVYVVTERDGRINRDTIVRTIPDWKERQFYISGPKSMTDSFRDILASLQVPAARIKTDFFPGFA